MIAFDLKCSAGHVFEAWFRSSADYQDQSQRRFLECPSCGDKQITKAIMAPNIGIKNNRKISPKSHPIPGSGNINGDIYAPEAEVSETQIPITQASRTQDFGDIEPDVSHVNGGLKTDQPAPPASPQESLRLKLLREGRAGLSPKSLSLASAEALQFFRALQDHVASTHDDVGDKFTETARKMHYGEEEKRGIYGQASAEDVSEMIDEGIDLLPLPRLKKNLQ